LMALVTTFMTTPLLELICPLRSAAKEPVVAETRLPQFSLKSSDTSAA